MTEIPSTDVIRHWVGWDNDEHDYSRVQLFDAWLNLELLAERKRLSKLIRAIGWDDPALASVFVNYILEVIDKGE